MSTVLKVDCLTKHYPVRGAWFGPRRVVHALDAVSFQLGEGETLAVVGESGCGKSTLAKALLRLTEPDSGSVLLGGTEIARGNAFDARSERRKIQIVFQDPYASLNPRRTIFQLLAEPMRLHAICPRSERRARATALLADVGLGAPFLDRHPHELSGGQRQRVAIARALALRPKVIVCDEPVSGLDVSVQAQVINLLRRLQRASGISYIFISHDLGLVFRIAHRVAVMYLGEIVELGEASAIRERMLHPYSQALFSATPIADPGAAAKRPRIVLAGELPSPIDLPSGCRFQTRCPYRQDICGTRVPELKAVGDRLVRCHFAGEPGFPPQQPAAVREGSAAAA
ncbi:MAG: oligopeptide/dipeptide ABC transporter ATP-binding protein [Casimicrobiaceae bacterium]